MTVRPIALLSLLGVLAIAGCGAAQETPDEVVLGPKDGLDLPAQDLERVKVGEPAPDFTLDSYRGEIVTLSDFRGEKNVVLVFYRGYW